MASRRSDRGAPAGGPPSPSGRLEIDGTVYHTRLTRKFEHRTPWRPPDPSRVAAHIPGQVRLIYVGPGARVARGERLLVLEAMKMQNEVLAPRDGLVVEVAVRRGDTVLKGQLLVVLEVEPER